MNNLKNFYPENYKLDLSETMKAALSKCPPPSGSGSSAGVGAAGAPHGDAMPPSGNASAPGVGYVTEKLYMLLQLYLQNKGWNPSAELLQCFTDLKDNSMLPSAAYLQVLANRLTLDTQGRLILRENGKIVLPFEHFANAVMLKHMSGPHGLHLSVEATVRAVIESYTIGRENFGMEKEFIIEVVQSCPSPACRYYKNHLGLSPLPFMEQQFPGVSPADFLQHLPHMPPHAAPHPMSSNAPSSSAGPGNPASSSGATSLNTTNLPPPVGNAPGVGVGVGVNSGIGEIDLTKPSQSSHVQQKMTPQLSHLTKQQANSIQSQLSQLSAAAAAKQQQQQQQLTAALIQQQQSRALAQQSLEKFSNLSPMEKQRVLQQLDPKHFDPMAVAAAAANLQMQGLMQSHSQAAMAAAVSNNSAASSTSSSSSSCAPGLGGNGTNALHQLPPPPPSPTMHSIHSMASAASTAHAVEQMVQKNVETLRSNLESLESNKDLLALHNGAWGGQDMNRDVLPVGQDKIVRVFAELMRNMARMKTYIRPSMCKPYGKQSESLQKTLLDTIQIVQTLRNCLPAPHIPVSSWKSESEGITPGHGGNMGMPGGVLGGNTNGGGMSVVGGSLSGRVENLSN